MRLHSGEDLSQDDAEKLFTKCAALPAPRVGIPSGTVSYEQWVKTMCDDAIEMKSAGKKFFGLF